MISSWHANAMRYDTVTTEAAQCSRDHRKAYPGGDKSEQVKTDVANYVL